MSKTTTTYSVAAVLPVVAATDDKGRTRVSTGNCQGRAVGSRDALGAVTAYVYDALDRFKCQTDVKAQGARKPAVIGTQAVSG